MSFNYFRIVVTLLASFGAFFAYICRLNLRQLCNNLNTFESLTIDQMVIKNDCPPIVEQRCNLTGTGALEPDFTSNSFMNNEEHTLAFISRSRSRKWAIPTAGDSKPNRRGFTGRSAPNRTSRLTKSSGPYGLSIVFDVSQGQTGAEQLPAVDQVSTTPASADENNPPDVDASIGEPAHLLNWSEKECNDLLGAFFFGYVIFQIPSARAAEIFGAKTLFLMTGLGASLCSLVFPIASKYSSGIYYAFATRFIMGATQGALFPAVYVFLCEWLPRSERSKWLPVPSAFSRIGTIVMNLVLPLIIINFNWESVFYVSGAAALVWCIVFLIFGSDSPQQSRWISKQEMMYIESHMEPRVGTLNVVQQQQTTSVTASGFSLNEPATEKKTLSKPSVSWTKMATNKAILMLTLVMFTSEWSNMLLLVKLPGFLGPVLKLDLVEVGFWSSVLVCIYCVQYPLSGFCASKLEAAQIESLSSLRVRKIFEAAAHLMQGTGCFMIAFSSDKTIVLIALFIIMLGRSTVGGGQCLMPPELSKDYPGTVFAFANTIANLAGIFGPKTVTWLVTDSREHSSWFSLWAFSGVLFFTGGFIFCLFADNKPQNYCKKSHKASSLSTAQLVNAPVSKGEPIEEIFKMDAFSRVASEPNPKNIGEQQHRD